jgi:4-amino-4-deoxy-L-arabinose transferase-like glycosyltransferase
MAQRERRRRRSGRPSTYLFFAALFAAVLVLSHWQLLGMPYHWDELGQFIPATHDLLERGLLVPASAEPNVHPPGVMAWLALAWKVGGVSIYSTRIAMLLLATLGLLAAFLLAIELGAQERGAPALLAAMLLAASPLFFAQSMLAQLDMPAMAFTALTLWLFLRGRWAAAALAAVALVWVKETGAVLPLLLLGWLVWERRWRAAAWMLLPLAALAAWIAYLWAQTGSPLGSASFAHYNVTYALNVWRIAAGLLRRLYSLFLADFHWIATLAILVALFKGAFRQRAWAVAGAFALLHVVAVTVLGGAMLERYLLPVYPIFYAAAAAALVRLGGLLARLAVGGQLAGLVLCLFINPPFWPFAYESNLAVVDFVELQRDAAGFLEMNLRGQTVTTAWPLIAALADPRLGYVSTPLAAQGGATFDPREYTAGKLRAPVDVFVLYMRDWDPPRNLLRFRLVQAAARRLWGYTAPIDGETVEQRFGLRPVYRRERGGQWIVVYAR